MTLSPEQLEKAFEALQKRNVTFPFIVTLLVGGVENVIEFQSDGTYKEIE